MEDGDWGHYIRRILVIPKVGKGGKLDLGITFEGGSENGMFIRCKDSRDVKYCDVQYSVPSWDPRNLVSLLCNGYPALRGPTKISCCGHNFGYLSSKEVLHKTDILITIDDIHTIGLPLAYLEEMISKKPLSQEYCALEVVSARHLTTTLKHGSPDELALYLNKPCSSRTYSNLSKREGVIRQIVYCFGAAFTTKPRQGESSILGFPVPYNYVTQEEFIRLKVKNRVLEYGVLNGYVYGTLLPDIPSCAAEWAEVCDRLAKALPLRRSLSFYEALHLDPRFNGDVLFAPNFPSRIQTGVRSNETN